MLRDFMIVAAVLLAMAAAVVGVFAGGLLHLKAVQKAANDNLPTTAPAAGVADTQSATRDSASLASDSAVVHTSSIDLWAKDATSHGDIQLIDEPVRAWKSRGRGGAVQVPLQHLTGFRTTHDYVEWAIEVPKAGEYEIALNSACSEWQRSHFVVRIFDQELPFVPITARAETLFRKAAVGRMMLPAGKTTLRIQASPQLNDHPFLNLREVEVVPTFQDAAPVVADP